MKKDYGQDVQREQTPVVIQPEEHAYLIPTAATAYTVAQLKSLQNNLLAVLAQQTMNNVSLLVANEARLLNYAPEGADLYRQIVESYTDAALSLVLGGEQ